jgi:phosphate transport system permease protein
MTESAHDREQIARAPTARELGTDRAFKWATRICAALSGLLVALILILIAKEAMPAIAKYGPHFIVSKRWDAGKGQFGILPEIFGTVLSSAIGVALAGLFGVVTAVFLT